MDTPVWTTGQVSELTGLSEPAVRRAADRLGLTPVSTVGGHRRFRPVEVAEIVRNVGSVPRVDGLTRIQVQVLAAVALHPIGLDSDRAVSRAARVSPTAATPALAALERHGYIEHQTVTVPDCGKAVNRERWRLLIGKPWLAVAGQVSRTVLPLEPPGKVPTRLPRRFWHLFWNADPAALDLRRDASFIATRMVLSRDVAARSWALRTLPREALADAGRNRAASPRDRALITAVVG